MTLLSFLLTFFAPPRRIADNDNAQAQRATVAQQPPVQGQPLDVAVLLAFEGVDAVDLNIFAWACVNREYLDHTSGKKETMILIQHRKEDIIMGFDERVVQKYEAILFWVGVHLY